MRTAARAVVRHNQRVVVVPDVARTFRVDRALSYVGILLAGGVGLSALYAATGVGIPCPFLALTGWECPLCGGTRMGAALLHGDLGAAYGHNPLALLALAVLGVLSLLWIVEALGGPALRPPARLRAAARRVGSLRWLVLSLVLVVAYTLFRNLG